MVQQIIVVLSTELGIDPCYIVAAMRDRASVNDGQLRLCTTVIHRHWMLLSYSGSRRRLDEHTGTKQVH